MLVLLGFAAFLVGTTFFLGCAWLWYLMAQWEYREPFQVICPETLQPVEIGVNGELAARTRFAGQEKLQVTGCSRWPERSECNQACTPQVPFLGDDRRKVKYAAFALPPRFLRINNPVRMTRELYDKLTEQLQHEGRGGRIA
jgi:hypothetical protein